MRDDFNLPCGELVRSPGPSRFCPVEQRADRNALWRRGELSLGEETRVRDEQRAAFQDEKSQRGRRSSGLLLDQAGVQRQLEVATLAQRPCVMVVSAPLHVERDSLVVG